MKIYTLTQPAEFCYLEEAAQWIAFGRLPEPEFFAPGVESRRSQEVLDDGEANYISTFFEDEFRAAGVSLDYELYLEWSEVSPGFSGLKNFDEMAARLREALGEEVDGYDSAARLKVKQIEDWEEPLKLMLDKARLKLIPLLMEGTLQGEGWVEYDPSPAEQETDAVRKFELIPASAWRPFNVDWPACTLQARDRSYNLIQLKTADLLKIFPIPPGNKTDVSASLYGDLIIINDAIADDKSLSRRGRPLKTGFAVGEVLASVFMDRLKKGELRGPKEAIVQEGIDWVHKTMGQRISRSTSQRYLAAVLELVPKSDAQNY